MPLKVLQDYSSENIQDFHRYIEVRAYEIQRKITKRSRSKKEHECSLKNSVKQLKNFKEVQFLPKRKFYDQRIMFLRKKKLHIKPLLLLSIIIH